MNDASGKFRDFSVGPGEGVRRGGEVYGLVSGVQVATRIAQAAKVCHLGVHNFDRATALVEQMLRQKPVMVALDWDTCEAEAFKVLKEMAANADLHSVPAVGFASQAKRLVMEDARRAGCHRVYTKTEFMRDLEVILARYAQ